MATEVKFDSDKQVTAPTTMRSAKLFSYSAFASESTIGVKVTPCDEKGAQVGGHVQCTVTKERVLALVAEGKSFEEAVLAAVVEHCGWA